MGLVNTYCSGISAYNGINSTHHWPDTILPEKDDNPVDTNKLSSFAYLYDGAIYLADNDFTYMNLKSTDETYYTGPKLNINNVNYTYDGLEYTIVYNCLNNGGISPNKYFGFSDWSNKQQCAFIGYILKEEYSSIVSPSNYGWSSSRYTTYDFGKKLIDEGYFSFDYINYTYFNNTISDWHNMKELYPEDFGFTRNVIYNIPYDELEEKAPAIIASIRSTGCIKIFMDAIKNNFLVKYITEAASRTMKFTKKYTNSTWSSSKNWYIKVTFSLNKSSYSNTTSGNVVNYVTMIRNNHYKNVA